MTHLFAAAITPRITSMPFIERWGGAVMPIEARSSYIGPDEKEVQVMQSYPVSCSHAGGLCEDGGFEQGYYTKLLPDDAYMSVSYLESAGPVSFLEGPSHTLSIAGRAKFTAWLNMQRLGMLSCGQAEMLALYTAKVLDARPAMVLAEDVYQYQASVQAKVTGMDFDPQRVFGRYSYAVNPRLFMHPYAAFALEMEFRAVVPANCLCLPEIESVECLEQW